MKKPSSVAERSYHTLIARIWTRLSSWIESLTNCIARQFGECEIGFNIPETKIIEQCGMLMLALEEGVEVVDKRKVLA